MASGNLAAFGASRESPIGEIACPRRIEILEHLDFFGVGDSIRIVRATAVLAILSDRDADRMTMAILSAGPRVNENHGVRASRPHASIGGTPPISRLATLIGHRNPLGQRPTA